MIKVEKVERYLATRIERKKVKVSEYFLETPFKLSGSFFSSVGRLRSHISKNQGIDPVQRTIRKYPLQ